MKKFISNKIVLYILGICLLLGVWFLVSTLVDIDSMVFPNPFKTIARMVELLGQKSTYRYLAFSVLRLLIGFAVSFVLAFLIGMLVHDNEKLYALFTPIMTFFKAAPTATFVFLFIILIGAKNAPVYVVITVTMPILYESIVSALKSASKTAVEASKLDGANNLQTLLRIQIPLGIPFIALGVVSTFAMAFKIEIMAEIITGFTNGGIGSIIHTSQIINVTDLTDMFAYSLMAIILVLMLTIATSLLKQKWTEKPRNRDLNKV